MLLAGGIWYSLAQLCVLAGVMPEGSISSAVGCAVMLAVVPAAWWSHQSERRQSARTLVCNQCHTLKPNDGRNACQCGGRFCAVEEMAWVSPDRAQK
jgi:hypothetical protein